MESIVSADSGIAQDSLLWRNDRRPRVDLIALHEIVDANKAVVVVELLVLDLDVGSHVPPTDWAMHSHVRLDRLVINDLILMTATEVVPGSEAPD